MNLAPPSAGRTLTATFAITPGLFDISGAAGYWPDPAALAVPDATMTLTADPGGSTVTVPTDPTGHYLLQDLTEGTTCTVVPSRTEEPGDRPAVSAFDAVLILQHTVGLVTLNEWQQTSADVSGDDNISAFDAVLILQLTVGLVDLPFPCGPVWRFAPEQRVYPDLSASHVDQDYVAVFMGDVNGSWVSPAATVTTP